MNIIEKSVQENLREKGSKFLGFLFPCSNLDEFNKELHQIKTLHPTATHHCYAYRVNPANIEEFSPDDGEPNGTAGLPILNQLKSAELVNIGAVIVRYFGGTKLGKAGLIETYGESTRICIEASSTKPIRLVIPVQILYQYPQQSIINKFKLTYQLAELEAEYLEDVKLTVACSPEFHSALIDELKKSEHLGITFEEFDATFMPVES